MTAARDAPARPPAAVDRIGEAAVGDVVRAAWAAGDPRCGHGYSVYRVPACVECEEEAGDG